MGNEGVPGAAPRARLADSPLASLPNWRNAYYDPGEDVMACRLVVARRCAGMG
jgi:hypothetical protein